MCSLNIAAITINDPIEQHTNGAIEVAITLVVLAQT